MGFSVVLTAIDIVASWLGERFAKFNFIRIPCETGYTAETPTEQN